MDYEDSSRMKDFIRLMFINRALETGWTVRKRGVSNSFEFTRANTNGPTDKDRDTFQSVRVRRSISEPRLS